MNRIQKFFHLLLAVVMLTAMIPAVAGAQDEDIHVVILATSDMHGNIWSYSYEDNAETANNGMARLYTYIKQVREENPTVFLVDAGDDIQGTIMTDDLAMEAVSAYADGGSVAVMALLAGNDLIITTDYRTQIPAVLAAVEDGTLAESVIDDACRRVLQWKSALGLLEF